MNIDSYCWRDVYYEDEKYMWSFDDDVGDEIVEWKGGWLVVGEYMLDDKLGNKLLVMLLFVLLLL